MVSVKQFYNLFSSLMYSVWGLTVVDLTEAFDIAALDSIDSDLKLVFSLLGLCYFVIQIPFKIIELNHKRKMHNIDRDIKKEELEHKRTENDYYTLRKDAKDM